MCMSSTLDIKCVVSFIQCVPIEGQGFIRGSYTCQCVDGYYFPNVHASEKYYSGQQIELYLELHDSERRSGIEATFRCARCSEGCDTCVDDSPCLYDDNKVLTSFLLLLTVALVLLVLIASFLIYWFRSKRVSISSVCGNDSHNRHCSKLSYKI